MTRAGAEKAKVQIDAQTAQRAADAIVEGVERKINGLSDVAGQKRKDGTIAKIDGKIETLRKTIQGVVDKDTGIRTGGLDEQKEALEKELRKAKGVFYARAERGADDDEMKEATDQVKEAQKALNDFITKTYNPTIRQLNDAQQELKVQEEELKAAEKERANVLTENSKKLELADKKYIGATVEAANARERSKIAEEQLVAEQEAHAANEQALDERT